VDSCSCELAKRKQSTKLGFEPKPSPPGSDTLPLRYSAVVVMLLARSCYAGGDREIRPPARNAKSEYLTPMQFIEEEGGNTSKQPVNNSENDQRLASVTRGG
jgi:hypothetical protein